MSAPEPKNLRGRTHEQLPLFFTYHDRVFGKGFIADVLSHGRVLAAIEDDEHWVYGVQPGSFAATGDEPTDAFRAYRQCFHNVLIDLAEESESSAEFEAAVNEMFYDVNILREQEWLSAVDEVRAGKVKLDIQRRENADSENHHCCPTRNTNEEDLKSSVML